MALLYLYVKIDVDHEDRFVWSIYLKKALESGGDEINFKKALTFSNDNSLQVQ